MQFLVAIRCIDQYSPSCLLRPLHLGVTYQDETLPKVAQDVRDYTATLGNNEKAAVSLGCR